jgi:hypothetical protein
MKKKSFITAFLLIILFSAFKNQSIKNPLFNQIFEKLATYTSNNPEKVYLQTDKDFYTNGETIWFKAYLLNGITHLKSSKSKLVYVDLVDLNDSIIVQKKIYIDDKNSYGDIKISKNIKQGKYILRSYTKYMLNKKEVILFQKEIPIWKQNTFSNELSKKSNPLKISKRSKEKIIKPKFQFFPEGGHLVYGITSTIGIKVTDNINNGIEIQGEIIDENNTVVAKFKTYKFGLGFTSFTPKIGKKYYAITTANNSPEKFQLPNPLPKGYVLTVNNKDNYINLKVETNIKNGLKGTLLLGHLRGDSFFKHLEKSKDKNSFSIKLMMNDLPNGVANFTLFTPNGEPVSQRLTFIDNPNNNVDLSIKTNKKSFNSRDKIAVDLKLLDKKGELLQGDFSMSVVTNSNFIEENNTIKSWLLLDSDLGGTIENANYFFEDNSLEKKQLLNALMLTHGWRRFVWKNLLNDRIPEKNTFEPEKGIMINGITTSFDNEYQPKKSVTKLNFIEQGLYQEEKATNLQGKFSFGPFLFNTKVKAILKATDMNGKNERKFSIHINNNLPVVNSRLIKKKTNNYKTEKIQAYLKKTNTLKYTANVTELKEVIIKTQKKKKADNINKQINSLTSMYSKPSARIFRDSNQGMNGGSVLDLIENVAGVNVTGTYPNQKVAIRKAASLNGGSAPLFLVDGRPSTLEFVAGMRSSEIEFIDVLKGPETATYGLRGGNGVVAIYQRGSIRFNRNTESYPGVTNFEINGFSKVREFYAPNYSKTKPQNEKPDYRTTLHWEPNIKLNSKENTTINFYSSDSFGEYLIKVEGVTTNGRIVNSLHNFTVSQ